MSSTSRSDGRRMFNSSKPLGRCRWQSEVMRVTWLNASFVKRCQFCGKNHVSFLEIQNAIFLKLFIVVFPIVPLFECWILSNIPPRYIWVPDHDITVCYVHRLCSALFGGRNERTFKRKMIQSRATPDEQGTSKSEHLFVGLDYGKMTMSRSFFTSNHCG